MRKRKEKAVAGTKRPWYKKWWVWFIIITIASAVVPKKETETSEPSTTVVEETTKETEAETTAEIKNVELDAKIACRALTSIFVEGALQEKYEWFSAEEYEYELDEDGNGKIHTLYMPEGKTKVNLTIVKSGDTYTVEYALLNGLYEVDMDTVPVDYKVLLTK